MSKKIEAVTYEHQEVRWLEWPKFKYGGRSGKPTEHYATECQVNVKGVTATITLPSGESFTKRLSTSGFEFGNALAKDATELAVANAKTELIGLTTAQLREWAEAHGIVGGVENNSFKRGLAALSINYDDMLDNEREAEAESIASSAVHRLTFYSDFKSGMDKFAITDDAGDPVWYGLSFEKLEQSKGELDAAKKAIWLAGKTREALGEDAIALKLFTDAQWLTTLWSAKSKARILYTLALKYRVALEVEWISGKDNPADYWTTARGFQKWSDVDLIGLARTISEEVAA